MKPWHALVRCLHGPTLTVVMLKTLQHPRTFLLSGTPKTLGAVDIPQDIIARCLGRMAKWTVLAHATLNAEFPNWELMACFAVFGLAHQTKVQEQVVTGERRKMLACIARSLGLNEMALISEFQHFEPHALKVSQAIRCSAFEAWRKAIRGTARADMQHRHPSSTLCLCLARLGTWSASSSDVERAFSRTAALRGGGKARTFMCAGRRTSLSCCVTRCRCRS